MVIVFAESLCSYVISVLSEQINSSGVGSNRVLQGPPIQVVGVALITEFCDHNYSFVEVILLN